MNKRTRTLDGLQQADFDLVKVQKTTLKSTATTNRTLLLPDQDDTLATLSDVISGGSGTAVTITGNQTITGIKTFAVPPTMGSITNTGTLTLPTGTGTLAKLTDIPDNTDYVDLNTNQSVSGIKTFVSAPVMSSITNTGTLTLPTGSGTLAKLTDIPDNTVYMDLSTNQSVNGIKTFGSDVAAPGVGVIRTIPPYNIATINNGNNSTATVSLPASSGTIALFSDIPTNATFVDLSSAQNITNTKTFTATQRFTKAGGTTATTGTVSFAPVSTAISGSNTYYWGVFQTPTTTGTSAGSTGSTVTILGNPSIVTNSYSLRVLLGPSGFPLGSVSAPSIVFGTTLNTGYYSSAAGVLNASIVGTNMFTLNSTGLTIPGKITSNSTQIGTSGVTINDMRAVATTISVPVAIAGGDSQVSTVSFASAFATAPSSVFVSITGNVGLTNTSLLVVGVLNAITTTSFDVRIRHVGPTGTLGTGTGTLNICYLAIQ